MRFGLLLAPALAVVAACGGKATTKPRTGEVLSALAPPRVEAVPVARAAGPTFHTEATVTVVPAGASPACPEGRIVSSFVDRGGRGMSRRLVAWSWTDRLDCGGDPACHHLSADRAPTFEDGATLVRQDSGDPQALWLSGGDLVMTSLGSSGGHRGARNAGVLVVRSSDCGATWAWQTFLPSATTQTPDGDFGDRPNPYVDPYDGTLYLDWDIQADASKRHVAVMTRSTDGARTFSPPTLFGGTDASRNERKTPLHFAASAPGAMRGGRLFAAWCAWSSWHPKLAWSDDGGVTWAPEIDVLAPGDAGCSGVPLSTGFRNPFANVTLAVTRAPASGVDRVVVAYEHAVAGRSAIRVVDVRVPRSGRPVVEPRILVRAATAGNDAFQSSLVGYDPRFGGEAAGFEGAVLLSWLESIPGGGLVARFAASPGDARWVGPFDASVDERGVAFAWPALFDPEGTFYGDYLQPASYPPSGGLPAFVIPFPRSSNGAPRPEAHIELRVVRPFGR